MEWLREKMDSSFQIKTQMRDQTHNVEWKVLNRIIRITKNGLEYEADQRHGEMIIAAMNLYKAKGVSSPGEKGKPWAEDEEATRLNPDMATEFRTLAARANYLALDRPDIQFATKYI